MKHLTLFMASTFLILATNSHATKLYCHGADSHSYDEVGGLREYYVGLDFDTSGGTAKIWKQENRETKTYLGKSLINNGHSIVL